jgi:hypothetical protein
MGSTCLLAACFSQVSMDKILATEDLLKLTDGNPNEQTAVVIS